MGALEGGGGGAPVSHVNFKKSQNPMSLDSPCPVISPLGASHVPCRFYEMTHVVSLIFVIITWLYWHVDSRNAYVAVSSLGVKDHEIGAGWGYLRLQCKFMKSVH